MTNNFYGILAQTGLDKLGIADWSLMGYWCIALGFIGYLCLQFGVLRSRTMSLIGGVLLLVAALLASWHEVTSLDTLILMLFFGLAGIGATLFAVAREPVYSALGFATAVLSSCGVLFMQYAYFVAAATMIVYAGATIIIFLFVLMFAQHEHLQTYDLRLNNPVVSGLVSAIILGLIYYCVDTTVLVPVKPEAMLTRQQSVAPLEVNNGQTAGLGRTIYTDYLYTVEMAGTLLLVATIGAIVVAARSSEIDLP